MQEGGPRETSAESRGAGRSSVSIGLTLTYQNPFEILGSYYKP